MKLSLIAAAALMALALGSGTASAQSLVPHRGHYHVVPSYSPPLVYGGYGYPTYSPGVVIGGYTSPGLGFGYSSFPSYGYGGYSGLPSYGYGNYYGLRGGHRHHHHHHHHGHW